MDLLDDERARTNYAILRDCLAEPIILKSAAPPPPPPPPPTPRRARSGKKRITKGRDVADPAAASLNAPSKEEEEGDEKPSEDTAGEEEDLAEFIDYLASEIFLALPPEVQTLSHAAVEESPRLAATYGDDDDDDDAPLSAETSTALLASVPASVTDTLTSYLLLPSSSSSSSSSSSPTATTKTRPGTTALSTFLLPILHAYISQTTAPPPPPPPPPPPSPNQHQHQHHNPACEICARTWIPLTSHHLIPRSVHAKALKRGWHPAESLNNLARLCRACHSFVHGLCSNEELARSWWSVELLLGREDVRRWKGWAGRVRGWKR